MAAVPVSTPCAADPAAAAALPRATPPDRGETLRLLAAQFESLLLGQMLRDMQADTRRSEESGGFSGLSDTIYSELAVALVKGGGVGLATSLEDALARTTPGGPAEAIAAGAPAVPRAFSPWMPEGPVAMAIDPERVSSAYGWRQDPIAGGARMHHGIDIPMAAGADVRSLQGGTVVESQERGGYGHTIVVDHGDGLTTRYAHLLARHVQVGDSVSAGQVVGLAGQSGRATGPHLHLEVRADGRSIDPLGEESARRLGALPPGTEKNPGPADDDREGVRR